MKLLQTLIIALMAVVIIGLWTERACNKPLRVSVRPQNGRTALPDPNYVQNPYEAQERLKAQGYYKGKIDGKWGAQTDQAYCDYCAVQEFKRYE